MPSSQSLIGRSRPGISSSARAAGFPAATGALAAHATLTKLVCTSPDFHRTQRAAAGSVLLQCAPNGVDFVSVVEAELGGELRLQLPRQGEAARRPALQGARVGAQQRQQAERATELFTSLQQFGYKLVVWEPHLPESTSD